MLIGPQDYPPSEDEEYVGRVAVPLAMGLGMACFFAWHEGVPMGAIAMRYNPGRGAAVDSDPLTRAREALRGQFEAREIAATMGYEAVVS